MKEGQPSLTAKVELKTRRLGYEAVTHPCLLAIMGPLIPRFANPRISNALRYARSPSLCSPCIVPLLIKPSPFLPHPALHLDLGFTSSCGIRTGKIGSPAGEIFFQSPPLYISCLYFHFSPRRSSLLESCWAL